MNPTPWEGVNVGNAYDGDGALYANNVRYYTDGELRRRHGLSAVSATVQSGTLATSFLHPVAGYYAVFFKTGSLFIVPL